MQMHREFQVARAEQTGEQPSFVIGGERFQCAPIGALPGGVLADVLLAPDVSERDDLDAGSVRALAFTFMEFIKSCLASNEERVRWHQVTHRPYQPSTVGEDGTVVDPGWEPVSLDALIDVGVWLVELYSARPTGHAVASSSPSSPGTGASSTAGGSPGADSAGQQLDQTSARLSRVVPGPPPADLRAQMEARQTQLDAGSPAASSVERLAPVPDVPDQTGALNPDETGSVAPAPGVQDGSQEQPALSTSPHGS